MCSDIEAFHESGQFLAEYIDPLGTESWKETILKYADINNNMQQQQIERLEKFKPITWDKQFEELDKLLH